MILAPSPLLRRSLQDLRDHPDLDDGRDWLRLVVHANSIASGHPMSDSVQAEISAIRGRIATRHPVTARVVG